MNRFLKNFSYSLGSNLTGFLISVLVTFIVPKVVGIKTYSLFQLYIFYIGYISLFSFGWCDGIYLNYGGVYYNTISKKKFGPQFWLFTLIELIIGSGIISLSCIFVDSSEKKYVLILVGICLIIHLPKAMLLYVLQATNRIKEYAIGTIIEKAIYFSMILLILIFKINDYRILICADLLGKTVVFLYLIYICKDICSAPICSFKEAVKEACSNINSGSKLLIANMASMLIIGIVRWGLQEQWDIETFGKISLTMSVSNLLMLLIRSISMIMFPVLRRLNSEKMKELYDIIRNGMMILLLGMLVFYYPIKIVLSHWLPQYAESLKYMAILFPMCVFESKMSMLIETYLKALRKEKILLCVNLMAVIFSAVLTYYTVFIQKNLGMSVLAIVILLGGKCIAAELYITKLLGLSCLRDILWEVFLVTVFIVGNWSVGGIKGLLIYFSLYFVYLIFKKNDCRELIEYSIKKYFQV